MGTFEGHVLPGFLNFIFGLHWTIGVFNLYYKALMKRKPRGQLGFRTRCTFPFPCCPKYPMEGVLKIALPGFGLSTVIIAEIVDKKTYSSKLENIQHMVMYFFFILSGLSDVLTSSGHCIPHNTDYAALLTAMTVSGALFHFHTNGHSMLHVHLHSLLVYMYVMGIICVALEMKYPRNPLCPMFRALSVLVTGTWFCQVGFILYNPLPNARVWDVNNHEEMMFATIIFAAHLVSNLLLVFLIGFLVYLKYRNELKKNQTDYEINKNLDQLITNGCATCKDSDEFDA